MHIFATFKTSFECPEQLRMPFIKHSAEVFKVDEGGWSPVRFEGSAESRELLIGTMCLLSVDGFVRVPAFQFLEKFVQEATKIL